MGKIKTAVIGVGSLGQHHARILSKHPKSELIAVVDSDIKRAEKIASIYKVPFFSDTEKIKNIIKAAVVAVPTPYHYEIAKDLLESGINCLVEKPFTSTIKEAQDLIEISKKKNLVLQVGHVERFNPAVVSAQNYINNPRLIEVDRLGPYDPRTSHIGVVLDLMIHDLDILLTLVKDKVSSLEAHGAKILSDNEDIVKVRIKFGNGCVADLSASRVSLEKYRRIRIFQPDSYISIDYAGKSLKVFRKKRDIVKSFSDIEIIRPILSPEEPLYLELDHFLSCVNEGKKPIVSGEHGRDAMELALEILKNMVF
ncbi:MAG: Gfo/Idh/MocA family oxidoreductase [Elusimicrobia bacterium]|nr:Gfo/Idh/MocA family oxidoreductase [Elusimicrobiota bacterium]